MINQPRIIIEDVQRAIRLILTYNHSRLACAVPSSVEHKYLAAARVAIIQCRAGRPSLVDQQIHRGQITMLSLMSTYFSATARRWDLTTKEVLHISRAVRLLRAQKQESY